MADIGTLDFWVTRQIWPQSGDNRDLTTWVTGQIWLSCFSQAAPTYSLSLGWGVYTLTGQAVNLVAGRALGIDPGAYTLTGQAVGLLVGRALGIACGTYTLTGQAITFTHVLYEGGEDMITFGTLLTRIQAALGDELGATWARTTTIWQFAQDALREFPIYRPKSATHTVLSDETHGFTLPNDFRQIVYVEYPIAQYPPVYLTRKSHLDADFYGQAGWYDVDRDYDEGGYYRLWTSQALTVGNECIIRYLAGHTFEFTSEGSNITVENQYVQILINHVVYMAYQERLALQLQDPTAHMSTIQQMSDACRVAEQRYLASLNAALEGLTSSDQIEGWKVDRFDRIY